MNHDRISAGFRSIACSRAGMYNAYGSQHVKPYDSYDHDAMDEVLVIGGIGRPKSMLMFAYVGSVSVFESVT
jgi:hypothetical protein